MAKTAPLLMLLGVLGCDPNVVDAVRDPPPMPVPTTSSSAEPPPASVSPLEISLIHRYSFDGDGTKVRDSKGAAPGEVMGATLSGAGHVTLAGEPSGQYVNLPDDLVSGLGDATFEVWLTWDGGDPWQRIFDFGNSSGGEDAQGRTGTSYLFLATVSTPDEGRMLSSSVLRLAYSQKGVGDEDVCNGPAPLPSGVLTHVAVVIERASKTMSLYQDGVLLNACFLDRPLSAIDDVNNWLGRSNYVADADFSGTYEEFRIYGAALTASEIADSFAAGPDAGL